MELFVMEGFVCLCDQVVRVIVRGYYRDFLTD